MTLELNDTLNETRVTFQVDASDPGAPQLEARLGAAGTPAVVAPPHPLMGGSLDNPGCRPLRFNWRGVGASTGAASDDLGAALADYRAALEHLVSLDAPADASVVAAGYSFGAVAAVHAATSQSEAGTRAPAKWISACRRV